MDDAGFREWLKWNGAGTDASRNTRVHAVRKIESSLGELGFDYPDLDVAYAADKLSALRATIRDIRADAVAGGQRARVLMPESESPQKRLPSWNSWLAQYGRFIDYRDNPGETDQFLTGMEQLKEKFLARMPDFESFKYEEGPFWDAEAQYKQDAHGATIFSANEPEKSEEERGREIYKRLSQSHAQGLPLGWRTQGEVAKAPADVQTSFYEIIARLARLAEDDLAGLEAAARGLESLRTEGLPNLKRGEVLGISISVFGTVKPNAACWFKVRTFDRLGKLLLSRKLFSSPQFEIEEFEEFQTLLYRMRDVLADWGWDPQNLTDVQGFIWVAMADDEGVEAKDGLTREAIEAAMDECEEIGVEAFLAKYKFGKPRDYWTRRALGGMLFPAKATVGAAHGFLPDGTPQSAKEFYGGFGEQAANGILQRLGFEIVTGKGTGVISESAEVSQASPTNLIFYGPPGTGKTYRTAEEAVRLCDGVAPDNRIELMNRYNRLVADERIGFVTFHQSFSYEEFVEGLRPVPIESEDGTAAGFHLQVEPGIFQQMASRAKIGGQAAASGFELGNRQIFKLSLGDATKAEWAWLFDEAIDEGYAYLGFENIDWSPSPYSERKAIFDSCLERGVRPGELSLQSGQVKSPDRFRNQLKIGDLLIVSKGLHLFRAIGVVEGQYEYAPRDNGHYCHRRKVRWLWVEPDGVKVTEISRKRFSIDTIYPLKREDLNLAAIERLAGAGQSKSDVVANLPFVLIIDEINRANISKVFGELITLIEPDKRLGSSNALTVQLPYSKREFGVPANLHIIGTMNTADRSIALLDTALRRRFTFKELLPDSSVLPTSIGDVSLAEVLTRLNERIEYLFDREHQIGHAYFIGCETRADIDERMRFRVIPLLAEYFYEDWAKVAAVLGDSEGKRFLQRQELKPPAGLDDDGEAPSRWRWSLRSEFTPDAYSGFS